MTGPVTGQFRSTFWFDVPADPGGSDPYAHEATTDRTFRGRDIAPAGAGMVPDLSQPEDQLVLAGENYGGSTGHRSSKDHSDRSAPWGYRRSPVDLNNAESVKHGGDHLDNPYDASPALGANHGGLRATGVTDAWANPLGRLAGHIYRIVHDSHRQGLHVNQPALRPIRTHSSADVHRRASPSPDTIYSSQGDPYTENFAGGGASQPRLRRIVRPLGQTDYIPTDADPNGYGKAQRPSPGNLAGADWLA